MITLDLPLIIQIASLLCLIIIAGSMAYIAFQLEALLIEVRAMMKQVTAALSQSQALMTKVNKLIDTAEAYMTQKKTSVISEIANFVQPLIGFLLNFLPKIGGKEKPFE